MLPSRQRVASSLPARILLSVIAITISSCSGNDPQGPPADVTPPTVGTVTPANASRSIAKNAAVTARFSEVVNPSTVKATTFIVRVGASPVDGVVELDESGRTATFTAAAPLANGADVTATIKGGPTGVADAAGNRLATDFSWTFRVNDLPVASAGPDRDVTRRSVAVTLNGSATDADGQSLIHTWTQVSGPPVGALAGATPSFTAPDDVTTLEFDLVVSDGLDQSAPDRVVVWVLDDGTKSVWVSPVGNDANPGTRAAPKQTIQHAIEAAASLGGDVYVAAGTYSSTSAVGLRAGVGVYGGFHATSFLRNRDAHETVIAGAQVAVQATAAHGATVDGFTILSVSGPSAGANSMGVVADGSRDLVIARNRITSGNGMAGAAGVTPARAAFGGAGRDGNSTTGGAGGSGGGSSGGAGGTGSPLNFLGLCGASPTAGSRGSGSGGGGGGAAGFFSDAVATSRGSPGDSGKTGAPGANATTPGGSFGGLSGSNYVPSNGSAGGNGANGAGGGGGGGADCRSVDVLVPPNAGGGGGGGGAGGVGGQAGTGGRGGGASFGIALLNGSTGATIVGNLITTGGGGVGGAGGNGGQGGERGPAGIPEGQVGTPFWMGGIGGLGGEGGWGGAGAGGGGGPSIGVLEDASSSSNLSAANLAGNVITVGEAGLGGAGGVRATGTSAVTAPSGANGLRAAFAKR